MTTDGPNRRQFGSRQARNRQQSEINRCANTMAKAIKKEKLAAEVHSQDCVGQIINTSFDKVFGKAKP
jgi:hypothetical protein